jgi:hypothetical protein
MAAAAEYAKILKSYEENPKVQILRKIRGEAALKQIGHATGAQAEWLAGWTAAEKGGARGFLYRRTLRRRAVEGIKVVSSRGGKLSVLGHETRKRARGGGGARRQKEICPCSPDVGDCPRCCAPN